MFSHPKTCSDQLRTQRKGGTHVSEVAASILQVQPRARLRGEVPLPAVADTAVPLGSLGWVLAAMLL